MTETTERGSALAAVRARAALRAAGLDATVDLVPASSVTNEVWLTPTHVVRVNSTRRQRLAREARIAASLPSAVRYPRIVAQGTRLGQEWSVSERALGVPLAHIWPDLDPAAREHAVHELAEVLELVHRTPVPDGLPPLEGAPQPLAPGTAEPIRPLIQALERVAALDHVDRGVVAETKALVEASAPALGTFSSATLVHGDLTFENVLWHDGSLSALLDLEWARTGPPDLDLDIVLRMCAYPELHVGPAHAARARAEDYADVPVWLADRYPALFAELHLLDRLRVYSIAFNVRELLSSPPTASIRSLSDLHPYKRLMRLLSGRSHLDELLERGLLARRPAPR